MKTMVITGASSGIGAATARAAVAEGWRVVLGARSEDKLAALVDGLGGAENAVAVACDVTSLEDQEQMMARARDAFGDIHCVFANAGIGASSAGTEQGDPDNWRQMILTNTLGAAITAKVAIPELKKTSGDLLLTGSRAGRIALNGSIYGATKWFVRGYVENLRNELSGTGIRVTNIAPGMVDTPFFDEAKPHALKPEDIARAVIYAVSQPPHVTVGDVLVLPTPKGDG